MKNPLKHIQSTSRWLELLAFVNRLKDKYQIRQLWRHLPLFREALKPRMKMRHFVSVQDYIVPCVRDNVERKALQAKIALRFSVGEVHDSNPPPADIQRQQMRDVILLKRHIAARALQELWTQSLRSPTVSDLVDFLITHGETVTEQDPVYTVTEEIGEMQSGRVIYRVLRASRTELGLFIEMPTDLNVRNVDGAILLPAGSRVLGVSPRPLADVLSISTWTSTPSGSSEPA